MMYRNNNKAWMTITLFQEWLKEFNYQVTRNHEGQRVLLFLNNCTSHKLEDLVLSHAQVERLKIGKIIWLKKRCLFLPIFAYFHLFLPILAYFRLF
jgi:hypothetical protein